MWILGQLFEIALLIFVLWIVAKIVIAIFGGAGRALAPPKTQTQIRRELGYDK